MPTTSPAAPGVPPATVRRAADVVVLGAPRSGTSLVAQLLASGGIGFGDHLLPPSPANPRGFLEDVRVTDLDDELLAPHVVGRGALPVPEARLAWAGAPDEGAVITADPHQRRRMEDLLVAGGPLGLKDPRFVWTLDAWRAVLRPGTVFVAVVRHPAEVAASLHALWEADRPYYGDLTVTVQRGLALWEAANRRILAHLRHGSWLVLDHAALLAGEGVAALAGFTGRTLDTGAVDGALHRSGRDVPVPAAAEELYERLRRRAGDDADRWSHDGR
ncbi:MAG TPA: sulfotransferase [Iamia sp.]|nr:sulfotransferase [Iamia sp.]